MIGSRSVYGRAPMTQLHSTPLMSLAVVTPEIKYIRRCHPCTRKCVSQAVLRRMQLTLHAIRRTPSGSSRLVLAMSAWSGKTRRVPSRHCREARVHDHTTTAMRDHEYTRPPSILHLPSSNTALRLCRILSIEYMSFPSHRVCAFSVYFHSI